MYDDCFIIVSNINILTKGFDAGFGICYWGTVEGETEGVGEGEEGEEANEENDDGDDDGVKGWYGWEYEGDGGAEENDGVTDEEEDDWYGWDWYWGWEFCISKYYKLNLIKYLNYHYSKIW